jgi:hypothetical protein
MSRRPTKKGGGGGAAEAVKINRIKVLSMGAAGSGKSCLVKRCVCVCVYVCVKYHRARAVVCAAVLYASKL